MSQPDPALRPHVGHPHNSPSLTPPMVPGPYNMDAERVPLAGPHLASSDSALSAGQSAVTSQTPISVAQSASGQQGNNAPHHHNQVRPLID